jgi:hypothetical protein
MHIRQVGSRPGKIGMLCRERERLSRHILWLCSEGWRGGGRNRVPGLGSSIEADRHIIPEPVGAARAGWISACTPTLRLCLCLRFFMSNERKASTYLIAIDVMFLRYLFSGTGPLSTSNLDILRWAKRSLISANQKFGPPGPPLWYSRSEARVPTGLQGTRQTCKACQGNGEET